MQNILKLVVGRLQIGKGKKMRKGKENNEPRIESITTRDYMGS